MHTSKVLRAGALALSLTLIPIASFAAPQGDSASQAAPATPVPLDHAVIMTCRQAWQAGGRNKDGFFAIVEELAQLSAQNRGVNLPDNKAAGERAGNWIRTQALKDPDQLLYAVVDHALQYSIAKGTAKPTASSAPTQ